jgi:Zn-dependent peptidase ImmA (M78 family)
MISHYESEDGHHEPSPATLDRLAGALEFPADFFFGPDLDTPALGGVSFRALSTLTAKQRDQAFGSAAFALTLARWIEAHYSLPAAAIPQLRGIGPEGAAEAVRDQWGLGQRPIRNMIHLLEAHGVRVFSLVEECAEVDAFSFSHHETPVVFLNSWKSAERSRMDAAHELGHLILHWGHMKSFSPEAEKEAQAFGAAFLMPKGSVLAEAPRHPQLRHLVDAKHRWNVAVANLTHRMHDLGLLSDWEYRMLFIEIGEAGYRRTEPEAGDRERSQVLEKVFRQSRSRGRSKADIAAELRIPLEEINKVVFGLVPTVMNGLGRVDGSEPSSPLRLVD